MARFTHRKFISAIAALSILVTGFGAAQAQAGSRDAERALAAIVGLAVIGAIVANNRDDDRHETQRVVRKPPRIEARPLPRDLQPGRHGNHHASRKELPRACMQEVRTNRGVARYFGARCMSRNYKFVNRLPNQCERRIRTDRGERYGWGAKCLRREGYTLARR